MMKFTYVKDQADNSEKNNWKENETKTQSYNHMLKPNERIY